MSAATAVRSFRPTSAFARHFGSMERTVLVLILFLGLVLTLTSEQFLTARNLSNLLLQVASIGIAAMGMTMIITTAGIDVSVGSTLGVTAVIMGKLAVAGYHPLVVLLGGMMTGGLIGLINGLLIVRGRIPPIIATLGTMNLLRALVFTLLGGRWISGIPMEVRSFTLGRWWGIPVPVMVMLALAVACHYFLTMRPTGRHIYAVGGNPEAAALAGIDANRILYLVYSLTGVLVALSGYIYIGRGGLVQTNAGEGFELQVIAATVLGGTSILGGRGTVIGSFLGALLVGILRNGLILLNVPALWEGVIVGTLILVAVVFDLLGKRGNR